MADPIEHLSSSPILQWALIAGSFLAGLITIWAAFIKPKSTPSNDRLEGIYRLLIEQRTDHARFANEHNEKLDEQTDVLRMIERNTDLERR